MELAKPESYQKDKEEAAATTASALPDTLHIGTQGLQKRILQKGNYWQKPSLGDEVEVHYNVRLQDSESFDPNHEHGKAFRFKLGQVHYNVRLQDSESFDPNHEHGKAFRFKLGQGDVIKGWDEGIVTMKKGERAVFTVPPELAYGELGSPPLIPPNSTLVFEIELVSWNAIRDITGDGCILKKIIREGGGWATPKEADQVLVKYEARLENGQVISKSEEGVEFSLLKGYLCPAMSKTVKTMRKGEKAELSVKFSYGLRECEKEEAGIGYGLGSNSNLIIDLELISWKNVVDVMGDKRILKKVLKIGEGFVRPTEGSLAKVRYIGKLEDGTVFERRGSNEEPYEYICSQEQINTGLDKAIMTMRKGEQAVVTVSSNLSSGIEVDTPISTDSVLVYEVELIDFSKEKPFWKMDAREKLEACERKKHDGNMLFKAGMFEHASKKYEKALKYIEYDHSFNTEERSQANALRLSCNLNNAASKLKLGEYIAASRLCTKALDLDPFSVKALFRRTQAYLQTSEFEKAEDDIKRALEIDPNNRDVKLVYKALKDKKKHYVRYEAEVFSTMLSKMAS